MRHLKECKEKIKFNRKKVYLSKMEEEYKNMYEAYCRFISYNEKLNTKFELTDEEKSELDKIRNKFKLRFAGRIISKLKEEKW